VLIETMSSPFRKMRATNATDNGFPSVLPTTTTPSGIGDAAAQTTASVFVVGHVNGGVVQNGCVAAFYGVGSDNNTFSARCYDWRKVPGTNSVPNLWVPILLCEVALTLSSTFPGIAGSPVGATELFADTITLTFGNSNVSIEVLSPGTTSANSGIAHLMMDMKGPTLLQWTFTTGGSATSCNGLFAML
jgi:hypothetical protein